MGPKIAPRPRAGDPSIGAGTQVFRFSLATPFRDRFRIDFLRFWHHFGSILGPFWKHFGPVLKELTRPKSNQPRQPTKTKETKPFNRTSPQTNQSTTCKNNKTCNTNQIKTDQSMQKYRPTNQPISHLTLNLAWRNARND